MEKLNSLPDTIVLGLEAVRSNLEQALRHDDVSQSLRTNLTKACEALDGFIQDAQQAKRELEATFQFAALYEPESPDGNEITNSKNKGDVIDRAIIGTAKIIS
jgi:hypothetical protein